MVLLAFVIGKQVLNQITHGGHTITQSGCIVTAIPRQW